MLIESLCLGLLILALRKQLVSYCGKITFRGLVLPILAFLMEALPVYGQKVLSPTVAAKMVGEVFWIELAVYMLLFGFIWLNRDHRGFKLMGAGLLLNGLVVLFNGGMMPVEGNVLLQLGFQNTYEQLRQGAIFAHSLIQSNTVFPILGDVIHLPPPYPFPKSVSIGDFVLGFGVLLHLAGYSRSQHDHGSAAEEFVK